MFLFVHGVSYFVFKIKYYEIFSANNLSLFYMSILYISAHFQISTSVNFMLNIYSIDLGCKYV